MPSVDANVVTPVAIFVRCVRVVVVGFPLVLSSIFLARGVGVSMPGFARWFGRPLVVRPYGFFFGEFDPGSGRTLAACLTHASRTVKPFGVDQWRTGE